MDTVAQGVQFELFPSLKNDLYDALVKELGLQSPDGMSLCPLSPKCKITHAHAANERCARLLAVDPLIEERRSNLKREQASLLEAREWLQSLTKDVPDFDDQMGMDVS